MTAVPFSGHDVDDTEPFGRGRTTIADRAVERIATRVLGEVDAVANDGRTARVRARGTGDTTTLQVRMSVIYPEPIPRTAQLVRAHLTDRIGELTGLTVSRVDITITPSRGGSTTQTRVK